MNKSNEELLEDWKEIVCLSWAFPSVYDMTLISLRKEIVKRKLIFPVIEDKLKYLRQQ